MSLNYTQDIENMSIFYMDKNSMDKLGKKQNNMYINFDYVIDDKSIIA